MGKQHTTTARRVTIETQGAEYKQLVQATDVLLVGLAKGSDWVKLLAIYGGARDAKQVMLCGKLTLVPKLVELQERLNTLMPATSTNSVEVPHGK